MKGISELLYESLWGRVDTNIVSHIDTYQKILKLVMNGTEYEEEQSYYSYLTIVPTTKTGYTFSNWIDEDGNVYLTGSLWNKDLTIEWI